MAIKKTELIEKRNILSEIRSNNMSLQELRFFSIYLSKINARDISTRQVTFPLSDFQRIMEFKRLNIAQLKATTNSLLGKIVNVPDNNGGYTAFQLFKECRVFKNDYEEWFIEIDAHDKALPLMFDFKREYFTYELWNALRLKSNNQLRMYEILKQYEKTGNRKIPLPQLRELLGVLPEEYPRWDRFRDRVLDSCQQALEENTDIKFTYKPIKTGRGGKITGIEFLISKNENYRDQLTLSEFIELHGDTEDLEFKSKEFEDETLDFLAGACENEFSKEEMQVLRDFLVQLVPYDSEKNMELERYNYLAAKYNELKYRAAKKEIKHRFAYLKKMMQSQS